MFITILSQLYKNIDGTNLKPKRKTDCPTTSLDIMAMFTQLAAGVILYLQGLNDAYTVKKIYF